jgi:hypothetical protein
MFCRSSAAGRGCPAHEVDVFVLLKRGGGEESELTSMSTPPSGKDQSLASSVAGRITFLTTPRPRDFPWFTATTSPSKTSVPSRYLIDFADRPSLFG